MASSRQWLVFATARSLSGPKIRSRSRRTLILVDQATENIPSDHRSRSNAEHRRRGLGVWRPHVERAMRAVMVVVRDVAPQDDTEMTAPKMRMRSRHSRRSDPTNRSANAFARGA
jgi:hypothetical protein